MSINSYMSPDLLRRLKVGDRDGNWQEIDAQAFDSSLGGTYHSGIARVVVRMDDDEEDYALGKQLCARIVAIPRLMSLIKAMLDNEPDARYDARELLKELEKAP